MVTDFMDELMVQKRVNDMAGVLQARGFRLTPQRLAIVKILAENRQHSSADQIYTIIRQVFPTISLATVYKTVEVLLATGQIHEVSFVDGRSHYDGTQAQPHPHLVCTRCKTIIDVEVEGFEALPEKVAVTYGYKNVGHRLEFFGICPRCQAETASAGIQLP